MLYWEYYLMGIILLPGLLLAAIAQFKVNYNFNYYNKVMTKKGDNAKEVARRILDSQGARSVNIISISGKLTDYYDPKSNSVALSSISASSSIAAIAVAAHEVGHALQKKEEYLPMKIRNVAVKLSNISSKFLWPLVVIGLIFNFAYVDGIIGQVFLWAGIGFFGVSVFFNLVTLPVEFNASNRALKILVDTGEIEQDEVYGCKKVLYAAALTYVAALVVSILNLLRFILVIAASRKD